jgi:hypothetical protein
MIQWSCGPFLSFHRRLLYAFFISSINKDFFNHRGHRAHGEKDVVFILSLCDLSALCG